LTRESKKKKQKMERAYVSAKSILGDENGFVGVVVNNFDIGKLRSCDVVVEGHYITILAACV